jgi:hypothetical protein
MGSEVRFAVCWKFEPVVLVRKWPSGTKRIEALAHSEIHLDITIQSNNSPTQPHRYCRLSFS